MSVGGFLLVAVGVLIVRQQGATRKLRNQLMGLRRQEAELAGLRAQNRDLGAWRISADDFKRLDRAHAEAEQLRTQNTALKARLELPSAQAPEGDETVSALDWKLAGRATPKAAFEGVLWAATHQDVAQLAPLLSFDAKTRQKVDAFFAQLPEETREQYGSPEKIAATMLAANMPENLAGTQTLSEGIQPEKATLLMQLQRDDGTHQDKFFNFQKASDGWQLVVPADVLSGYERQLSDPKKALPGVESGSAKP